MSAFTSLYSHEFLRIASCVPRTRVADPDFAEQETLRLAEQGHADTVALMLFPELGISSYAIDDLLFLDALLDAVEGAIGRLAEASTQFYPVLVIGAPLRCEGHLYNSAVVIYRGAILGAIPKTYLPNYREFYERRHFTSGAGVSDATVTIAARTVPFGTDLVFRSSGSVPFTFHVEICEDIWAPLPPSTRAAMAGAEVLLNLSASNITIGKADVRRLLCASQSHRAIAAYSYSAAGFGESTTDLAGDGHAAIFEYGDLLAETQRFPTDTTLVEADIDLDRLRQERMRVNSFRDCARQELGAAHRYRVVSFVVDQPARPVALRRTIERFAYVPAEADRCPVRHRVNSVAYTVPSSSRSIDRQEPVCLIKLFDCIFDAASQDG